MVPFNENLAERLDCKDTPPYDKSVWLYDPFSFTPWYTSALALALKERKTQVRLLGCNITREPDYYTKVGLELHGGVLVGLPLHALGLATELHAIHHPRHGSSAR